jgi:hypothetical protein
MLHRWHCAVIPLAAKTCLVVTSLAPIQYLPGSLRANLLLPINLPARPHLPCRQNDPGIIIDIPIGIAELGVVKDVGFGSQADVRLEERWGLEAGIF